MVAESCLNPVDRLRPGSRRVPCQDAAPVEDVGYCAQPSRQRNLVDEGMHDEILTPVDGGFMPSTVSPAVSSCMVDRIELTRDEVRFMQLSHNSSQPRRRIVLATGNRYRRGIRRGQDRMLP
jgi:hypothetical protein